jgi:Zn-dependent protease
MQEPDPRHWQPPSTPPQPSFWKRLLAPLGVVGVAILKFGAQLKFLILPLIKFLPVLLKTGGSMFLMIWIYAMRGGWPVAIGFVVLLFVHESGHLIAARMMGLKVGAPVFIPFMGAFIALKDAPRNAWIEAVVGIGGPVAGALGAAACHFAYAATGQILWAVLASLGYFLNLFNLIPLSPLDGGRIASAISPWLWVVGFLVLVGLIASGSFNFILIFILIMAIPRLLTLFRPRDEATARYFELTPEQRWTMGIAYFALAGLLALGMHEMDGVLQGFRSGS